MTKVPNPGSDEAINRGCICAVLDNGHGRGFGPDPEHPLFWITDECPLHGHGRSLDGFSSNSFTDNS